ncbi:MAG TPA: hypothetical protein VIP77_14415 [Jiangellaceae bacterium]
MTAPADNPRRTIDQIASDELDQLYERVARAEAERDTARQHAAAISAQRDRLRQRMNTLADRWDHALPVDKPYARTLRNEISVAPFHGEHTAVQPYQADDRTTKWAARCWGTDTCDGWLSLDHDTQRWAEIALDRHVTEAHAAPMDPAEAALARYAPSPVSAERAAVLREVADRLKQKADALTEDMHDLAMFVAKARIAEAEILDREAEELRRLADEAPQQPETQAVDWATVVQPLTEADRGEEDGAREWADYMRGWNNCRTEMLAAPERRAR